MSDIPLTEKVHGYEIKKSVLFENDRGFALAENPNAPQPFVTWQFTESEGGRRDYYWGHYTQSADSAAKDFETRITDYQQSYGVSEKAARPAEIVNFDQRESVENGKFLAWGHLLYHAPLTENQMADYELRAALSNPDRFRLTPEQLEQQAQVVGKWEQSKHIPDAKRLTWWYPDFGVFVKNELVSDAELSKCYEKVMESEARSARKIPITARLQEGAEQATKDNVARPVPTKNTEKDR